MSEQRFTFKPAELRHITIGCGNCKTKMTFDISVPSLSVEYCPGCHQHLPHLNRLLSDYRAFQSTAQTEYFSVQLETPAVSL